MVKDREAADQISLTLPAAGASATSSSLDLGEETPSILAEELDITIAHPALASLADGKYLRLTLEDSADDSTFAAVPGIQIESLGAGGAGAGAKSVNIKLPGDIARYVRLKAEVEAAGGDNTGSAATIDFYF